MKIWTITLYLLILVYYITNAGNAILPLDNILPLLMKFHIARVLKRLFLFPIFFLKKNK